jgi:16S rRNA G1207 methylase RsmC
VGTVGGAVVIRASAKALELRSLNVGLFYAGMDLMRRESALTRARAEKEPKVKAILVATARDAHRSYMKSLNRAAGIQHAMETRASIDNYMQLTVGLVLQSMRQPS